MQHYPDNSAKGSLKPTVVAIYFCSWFCVVNNITWLIIRCKYSTEGPLLKKSNAINRSTNHTVYHIIHNRYNTVTPFFSTPQNMLNLLHGKSITACGFVFFLLRSNISLTTCRPVPPDISSVNSPMINVRFKATFNCIKSTITVSIEVAQRLISIAVLARPG